MGGPDIQGRQSVSRYYVRGIRLACSLSPWSPTQCRLTEAVRVADAEPTDVWHASGSQPPLAVGRDTGPRVRCTPCWLGRIAAVSRDALTPSRVRSRLIEFVLDGRPKVNTCRQLVQQRKQALRVGLLEPGDQLPKVRDVAQSLVVNPNSVLKAYRELEIEGLAAGRRVSARSCSARRPVRPWPIRQNCARTWWPGCAGRRRPG